MKNLIITCFCVCVLHLAPQFVFGQVPSAPVITRFTPTAQCSGGTVTIIGQNFVNVQAVRSGGVNMRSFSVNTSGDTIRAILASGGATGLVSVHTTLATVASVTTFTYLGCPPVLPVIRDVRPFPIITQDSSVDATMIMTGVCACLREGFYIALEKQTGIALLRDTIIPSELTATSCRFVVPRRLVNTPGNIRCSLNQGTYRVVSTTLTVTTLTPQPPLPPPIFASAIQDRNTLVIQGMNFSSIATVQLTNSQIMQSVDLTILLISSTRIVVQLISTRPASTQDIWVVKNPDGRYVTFVLQTVNVRDSTQNQSIHCFPNPAHETVTIETDNPTPRTITLILRNTLGQELMRLTKEMPAGRVTTPLEVGRFPAGTYFLEIQNGSERVVERLVKY